MNMISCGERCRHQKNGYCMLDGRSRISSSVSSSCCYFEEAEISEGGASYDKNEKPDENI